MNALMVAASAMPSFANHEDRAARSGEPSSDTGDRLRARRALCKEP